MPGVDSFAVRGELARGVAAVADSGAKGGCVPRLFRQQRVLSQSTGKGALGQTADIDGVDVQPDCGRDRRNKHPDAERADAWQCRVEFDVEGFTQPRQAGRGAEAVNGAEGRQRLQQGSRGVLLLQRQIEQVVVAADQIAEQFTRPRCQWAPRTDGCCLGQTAAEPDDEVT